MARWAAWKVWHQLAINFYSCNTELHAWSHAFLSSHWRCVWLRRHVHHRQATGDCAQKLTASSLTNVTSNASVKMDPMAVHQSFGAQAPGDAVAQMLRFDTEIMDSRIPSHAHRTPSLGPRGKVMPRQDSGQLLGLRDGTSKHVCHSVHATSQDWQKYQRRQLIGNAQVVPTKLWSKTKQASHIPTLAKIMPIGIYFMLFYIISYFLYYSRLFYFLLHHSVWLCISAVSVYI